MHIKTTSGSGAAGLGIVGTGLALALPEARWIGWLLVAAGLLVFAFDVRIERGQIRARGYKLSQFGPWILIICGPLVGLAWLYFQNNSIDRPSENSSPVARLAELGWSVKSGVDSIQFGISNAALPSMKESAIHFGQLSKPFTLHFQQVAGLEGLHHLSSMQGCTKIEIGAGEFTDISELAGFGHLKTLVIGQLPLNGTGTVDLAPLASLTNLELLGLNSVRARNVEALRPLKNLKSLNLGQTLISDVSPIEDLRLLESFEVRGTRVSDLGPLRHAENLRDLTISGAQVPSLGKLAHLSKLKKIMIIEQQGVDLSGVSTLTNLESLWVWAGQSSVNILPLQSLTNLRSLTLTGLGFGALTAVPNLEVVGELGKLHELTLGSLQYSDVQFLSKLDNLSEVNLNQLPISSIEPLRGLKSIKKISLVDIPVIDISVLLDLPLLTDLRTIRVPARSDVLTELARRGVKVN